MFYLLKLNFNDSCIHLLNTGSTLHDAENMSTRTDLDEITKHDSSSQFGETIKLPITIASLVTSEATHAIVHPLLSTQTSLTNTIVEPILFNNSHRSLTNSIDNSSLQEFNTLSLGTEDDHEMNLIKQRRKRKPNKTMRMSGDAESTSVDLSLENNFNKIHFDINGTNVLKKSPNNISNEKISIFNKDNHVLNSVNGNTLSQEEQENIVNRNQILQLNEKKLLLNENNTECTGVTTNEKYNNKILKKYENDECETIDKIAEMIAKSNNPENSLPKQSVVQENICCTEIDLEKTLNGTLCDLNNKSFEEVEYKLEEMFAGIDDDRPTQESTVNVNKDDGAFCKSNDVANKILKSYDSLENSNGLKNIENESSNKLIIESNSDKLLQLDSQKSRKRPLIKKNVIHTIKINKEISGKFSKFKDNTKYKNNKIQNLIPFNKDEDKNYRGPFVHIHDSGNISIVNTPNNEEDSEKQHYKLKCKKIVSGQAVNERTQIRGLHISTLSIKYDADTRDTSWICVFCKIGPHKHGLGDLFGPYILSSTCEEFQFSKTNPENDVFKSRQVKHNMSHKKIGEKKILSNNVRELNIHMPYVLQKSINIFKYY